MGDLFDTPNTDGGIDFHADRREARRDEEHCERMHNARQNKPKPLCTNCIQSVEWSRVDGSWWPFIPGTTEQHRCKR